MKHKKANSPQDYLSQWSEVQGDCVVFTGAKTKAGYGDVHKVRWGLEFKVSTAHRLAWTLAFGPIPKGMLVCHKCDTRSCINPKHLFLGTHQDNSSDMVSKGRSPTGPLSKLTLDQQEEVKRLKGRVSYKEVAPRYGISPSYLYKLWKDV